MVSALAALFAFWRRDRSDDGWIRDPKSLARFFRTADGLCWEQVPIVRHGEAVDFSLWPVHPSRFQFDDAGKIIAARPVQFPVFETWDEYPNHSKRMKGIPRGVFA